MSFLFRLAAARVPAVRAMLEGLAKVLPLSDELAVHAAMHLARDHGKKHMRDSIVEAASGKKEELKGVASAALWDLGDRVLARATAEETESSKWIGAVTWGALVMAADESKGVCHSVLSETTFRRVQSGWVE